MTEALPQELIDEFVENAHGNLARVQELLAAHPELLMARSSWDETALAAAAHSGAVEIAELLLEAGAELDICSAAMLGQVDEVRARLSDDPSLANATGAHGISVLYHAVITGQLEVAQLLLEHGADVDAGAGVDTPLHGAARHGRTALAAWLLVQGANRELLDYEGKTPLQVAEAAGHDAVAVLLRERPEGD